MRDEITVAAKTAPAIGGASFAAASPVAEAAAAGLTLNEWVALATLIYVLAQLGLLLPKYRAAFRKGRAR